MLSLACFLIYLCFWLKSPCFLCLMLCFMLRSTSLHAYIFRSKFFMLYAMLSMLRSSLSYVFYVRSTYFHVSYHVFVPRSIFPMCCLARSTCFYGCLHVYLSFLHALCFMPCLDPSFLCVDVWIYMLTCLISCLWLCYA